MKPTKNSIYYARSEDALRNGSYYRQDNQKSGKLAWYMNGDYISEIEFLKLPIGLIAFTRADAKPLIPKCCL